MKILQGKVVAQEVEKQVKAEVKALKNKGVSPCLSVILVGDDPASSVYVRNKENKCRELGIESKGYHLEENTTQEELLKLIGELNHDDSVHGILVQLPLPKQIDERAVIEAIDPKKDVDGFHPVNVGKSRMGLPAVSSCTPAGVIEILDYYDIPIAGKICVVLGRSNIVGKPMANLLLHRDGTVIVCHSKTKDLKKLTSQADILVCAVGKPKFVTEDFIKPGAVVIDVGIHRLEGGKLCGDVDNLAEESKASAVTPVPGGVGPMTIAMLMKNTVFAANQQIKK